MSFKDTQKDRMEVKVISNLHSNNLDDRWNNGQDKNKSSSVIAKGYSCGHVCTDSASGKECGDISCPQRKECSKENPTIYKYSYEHCRGAGTHGTCFHPNWIERKQFYYQLCGKMDPKYSCGVQYLNQDSVGTCRSEECIQNKDWTSLWDSSNMNADNSPTKGKEKGGTIYCMYNYPKVANYNYTNASKDLIDVNFWLDAIIKGTAVEKKSFTTLPIEIKNWLRDTMIIYLSSRYWHEGLYKGWGLEEDDDHWDFISEGNISSIKSRKDNLTSLLEQNFNQRYPTSPLLPSKLKESINKNCVIPMLDMDDKDIYINIPLSQSQYVLYTESKDKSGYLVDNLAWLLDDKNSNVINKDIPLKPELTIINDKYKVNTIVIDEDNYYSSNNISYQDFFSNNEDKYTDNFLTSYIIRCKITGWTGILMVFALTKLSNIPDIIINTMINQTGFLPLSEFEKDCSGDAIESQKIKCLQYIKEHCSKYTYPPQYTGTNIISNVIFTGDLAGGTNACQCYNSQLQPKIGATQGNITAMCFDKTCNNNTLKSLFNLSDKRCSTECNKMWNWINNKDPYNDQEGVSVQYLDEGRFRNICNEKYSPFNTLIFNKFLAIYLSLIVILVISIIFVILKHVQISNTKISIIVLIVFLFLSLLSLFILEDTKGIPDCKGDKYPKEPVCKSKYTKIYIPEEFCTTLSACECDVKCENDDCNCISQLCIPKDPKKAGNIIRNLNSHIIKWRVVMSIILLVLTIILSSCMILFTDYLILSGAVFTGMISLIIFLFSFAFVKRIDTKFYDSCIKT